MTKAQVRGFIEALANLNPAPETELSFADPFTLSFVLDFMISFRTWTAGRLCQL